MFVLNTLNRTFHSAQKHADGYPADTDNAGQTQTTLDGTLVTPAAYAQTRARNPACSHSRCASRASSASPLRNCVSWRVCLPRARRDQRAAEPARQGHLLRLRGRCQARRVTPYVPPRPFPLYPLKQWLTAYAPTQARPAPAAQDACELAPRAPCCPCTTTRSPPRHIPRIHEGALR